jgi:hypothetical protein
VPSEITDKPLLCEELTLNLSVRLKTVIQSTPSTTSAFSRSRYAFETSLVKVERRCYTESSGEAYTRRRNSSASAILRLPARVNRRSHAERNG